MKIEEIEQNRSSRKLKKLIVLRFFSNLRKMSSVLFDVFLEVYNFKKLIVIYSIFVYIIAAIYSYVNVLLSRTIINEITNNNKNVIIGLIFTMAAIKVITLFFQTYQNILSSKLVEEFTTKKLSEMVLLISKMELLEKEHPTFSGKFGSYAFASIKFINIYNVSLQFIQYLLTAVLSFYYLAESNWLISLVVLLGIIIKAVIEYKVIKSKVNLQRKINKERRYHEYLYNLITGTEAQKELTLFRSFDFFKNKWLEKRNRSINLTLEIEKISNKSNFFSQIISIITLLIINIGVVFLILNNKLTIGDYVGILMAVGLAEGSFSNMIRSFNNLSESTEYINDFNDLKQKITSENEKQYDDVCFNSDIEIRNLTFTYPNREKPAIHNLNMKIYKGEKLVIIGDNAAGKSTLVKLLLGLYKSPKNTIFYDGIDQNQINRNSIYEKSSVVFQDYVKYMLSIRDNLNFGNQIDDKQIKEVMEKVSLESLFRDLKNGFDTELGYLTDESINLSGGQWQRLVLARALLNQRANILIFDEPTSSIDPIAELEIFNLILNLASERTCIIITHRVGIASKADRILVMENGIIIEEGSHEELLKNGLKYSDIWNKQREWYY